MQIYQIPIYTSLHTLGYARLRHTQLKMASMCMTRCSITFLLVVLAAIKLGIAQSFSEFIRRLYKYAGLDFIQLQLCSVLWRSGCMASLNFQTSHVSRDLDMDNRTRLHSLMIYNYNHIRLITLPGRTQSRLCRASRPRVYVYKAYQLSCIYT